MGRVFLLLLALSGLWFAAPASAAAPSATPRTAKAITGPDWLRRPSADDISRYYPPAARDHDISGHVRVQCRLANDGVLTDCVVLSETPTGYGFGEAALNVASRFQMRPGTRDGQPIAGQIVIPITFAAEDPGPFTRPGGGPAPKATLAAAFLLLVFVTWLGWTIFL
jgi:TonB family protein